MLILVLVSVVFSAVASAQGSDKGNGGMGVKCGSKVFVLEEYTLKKHRKALEEFESISDLSAAVSAKLGSENQDLYHRFLGAYATIGDVDQWKEGQPTFTFDSLDFSVLSPDCNFVQLAVQFKGKVTIQKTLKTLLTRDQKLILLSHEAFYFVGVSDYQHTNSVLVRRMVEAIFSKDVKQVPQDLIVAFRRNFIDPPSLPVKKIRAGMPFRTYDLHSWRSEKTALASDLKCPAGFGLDYNGDRGIAMILVYDPFPGTKNSTQLYGLKMNLNFGEPQVVEGAITTLSYGERENALLVKKTDNGTKMTDVLMVVPSPTFPSVSYVLTGRFVNASILSDDQMIDALVADGLVCGYERIEEETGSFYIQELLEKHQK